MDFSLTQSARCRLANTLVCLLLTPRPRLMEQPTWNAALTATESEEKALHIEYRLLRLPHTSLPLSFHWSKTLISNQQGSVILQLPQKRRGTGSPDECRTISSERSLNKPEFYVEVSVCVVLCMSPGKRPIALIRFLKGSDTITIKNCWTSWKLSCKQLIARQGNLQHEWEAEMIKELWVWVCMHASVCMVVRKEVEQICRPKGRSQRTRMMDYRHNVWGEMTDVARFSQDGWGDMSSILQKC